MRHPLRHRALCVLAALSLVFSAAPSPAAATAAEGDLSVCAVGDVPSVSGTAELGAGPSAAAARAQLDTGGLPCGPGPCSVPFTTCAASGTCVSITSLPVDASPSLSSGLLGVVAVGTDSGLPSPASRILTPPPRS